MVLYTILVRISLQNIRFLAPVNTISNRFLSVLRGGVKVNCQKSIIKEGLKCIETYQAKHVEYSQQAVLLFYCVLELLFNLFGVVIELRRTLASSQKKG
jgi:hypothetical protein